MHIKKIIVSCDICNKEISITTDEDHIKKYKWGSVYFNGRAYDLCPEHENQVKEINSRFDNDMSKLLERK